MAPAPRPPSGAPLNGPSSIMGTFTRGRPGFSGGGPRGRDHAASGIAAGRETVACVGEAAFVTDNPPEPAKQASKKRNSARMPRRREVFELPRTAPPFSESALRTLTFFVWRPGHAGRLYTSA